MAQLFTNNSFSTLASGIASGAGSLTLAAGAGAKFPSPSGGDFFDITLTQAGTETSWEIARCTARSIDTLTIGQRGVNGTTAAAWLAGDKVEIRITAAWLNGANPQVRTAPVTMQETTASSSSYTWAVDTAPHLVLTTTGALTMNAPSGLAQGTFYFLEVVYGGAHAIAWNSTGFKGVSTVTPTSASAARDVFVFKAQSSSVLELVGFRANVGA